jgi:GlcNAc-P-P-Und epimerase
MMKFACVIGGSGFIGTRLCQRFNKNKKIDFVIVDKAASSAFPDQVKIADVRSQEALRNAIEPNSILINLAAEHRDDVRPLSLYEDVNIQGAKNLCAVAREKMLISLCLRALLLYMGSRH